MPLSMPRLSVFSRRLWAMGLVAASSWAGSAQAAPAKMPFSFACPQQVQCAGEIWLPEAQADGRKPPVVIMAHGFGATIEFGLKPFAERFTQAGMAVVLFDYRGFGVSGGQPRQVVDGEEHVKDWVAAIDAVAKHPEVDGQRLAIWGSSYSGGHVLKAAAQRPQAVKAVSSQVPFVNGLSSSLLFPLKYQPVAGFQALRDMVRGASAEPLYVPTVAKEGFAALICPECWDGYLKLVPKGHEAQLNRVAARVFMSLPFYNPGDAAKDIAAPVLMIAATNDGLIPIQKVREVAATLKHGTFIELKDAHHFSPYTGPVFEQVVAKQTAFFQAKLGR
ncbi:MAG: hypothetical protein RI907_2433 [Pseudomonadota bacterium]|jgi:pimeloyl-ACP methyl ester carboxylesterase